MFSPFCSLLRRGYQNPSSNINSRVLPEEDAAAEERFISRYTHLTGDSAAQALRHRDPTVTDSNKASN